MRKTAYKHDVKTHTRNGKTVKSYVRGKGNKPRDNRISKPHTPRASKNATFMGTIYFLGGSESHPVKAGPINRAVASLLKKQRRGGFVTKIVLDRV